MAGQFPQHLKRGTLFASTTSRHPLHPVQANVRVRVMYRGPAPRLYESANGSIAGDRSAYLLQWLYVSGCVFICKERFDHLCILLRGEPSNQEKDSQ